MFRKKIGSIEFRVFDPQTIRKMSAIDIKTPETYDKDGFPLEEGLMDPHLGVINPGLRCKTCGQKMKQCPGHFGSFELIRPIVHPGYGKKIEELLSSTCKECGKITLTEEELAKLRKKTPSGEELAKKIKSKASKIRKCPFCNAIREKVLLDRPTNFYYGEERIYPTQIRDWLEKIKDEELLLFGFNIAIIRPEWLVLTVLPVPPITIR